MIIFKYTGAAQGSFFQKVDVTNKKDIEDALMGVHQFGDGSLSNLEISGLVIHYAEYDSDKIKHIFKGIKHIRYTTRNMQKIIVFPLLENIGKKEHDTLAAQISNYCIKNGVIPNRTSFSPLYELNGANEIEFETTNIFITELVINMEVSPRVVRYNSTQRSLIMNMNIEQGEVALCCDFISKKTIPFTEWSNIIAVLNNLGLYDVFSKIMFNFPNSDRGFYKFDINKNLKSGYILYVASLYGYTLPSHVEKIVDDGTDSKTIELISKLESILDPNNDSDYRALYYEKGLSFLKVVDEELVCTSISPTILVENKKEREALMYYCMTKRLFFAPPMSLKKWGLWENDELVRDWDSGSNVSVNQNTGIVTIQKKYPVLNDSLKDLYIEYIELILKFIFDDAGIINIIRKFMAQIICSYRTLARPALILTGLRGTGKGLFVDTLLGSMVKVTRYINTPYDATWKESAGVIKVEESDEIKFDYKKLYNDIKDYSGAPYTTANIKTGQMYTIPATGTFIILSNESFPVQIKDDPRMGNQFFHIDLPVVLEEKPGWYEMAGQISESKVKIAMNYYTKFVLVPLFERMKNDKPERYGFKIPVTTRLINLYEQSNLTKHGTDVQDFFNDVWMVYSGTASLMSTPYSLLNEEEIHCIKEHLFVPSTARKKLAPRLGIKSLASINIINFQINAIRLTTRSVTGLKITSREALEKFLFPEDKKVLEISAEVMKENTLSIQEYKTKKSNVTPTETEILNSLGFNVPRGRM